MRSRPLAHACGGVKMMGPCEQPNPKISAIASSCRLASMGYAPMSQQTIGFRVLCQDRSSLGKKQCCCPFLEKLHHCPMHKKPHTECQTGEAVCLPEGQTQLSGKQKRQEKRHDDWHSCEDTL